MKKIYFLILICFLAILFNSCSDEDKEQNYDKKESVGDITQASNARLKIDETKLKNNLRVFKNAFEIRFGNKKQDDKIFINKNSNVSIPVILKNTSTETWYPDGMYPINLSYWVFDESGQLLFQEGTRTRINKDIAPNEEITVDLTISRHIELNKGKYTVIPTIVQETISWFNHFDNKSVLIKIICE